jgi:hypothetical protein
MRASTSRLSQVKWCIVARRDGDGARSGERGESPNARLIRRHKRVPMAATLEPDANWLPLAT